MPHPTPSTPKLDLVTHPITTVSIPYPTGEIPDNLANHTLEILRLHAKNGSLRWVSDMIAELESPRVA